LTDQQITELYQTRCKDLKCTYKEQQLLLFSQIVRSKCKDRKLNLSGLFLGEASAELIAEWILAGEIELGQLVLRENQIGDKGLAKLAPAIIESQSLCHIDLSSNGFTSKCAKTLYKIFSNDTHCISLNLGSALNSQMPNRMGQECFAQLGRLF
jgi:Ran GTPase-activating protein (RanGAP) involved in mRNA processing and transport